MPIHDWTRVEAGIFHDFHHEWISTIRRALNSGLLPPEYYALAEQQAAGFGPDVLTLQAPSSEASESPKTGAPPDGATGLQLAPPKTRFTAESAQEFHHPKKSTIVVRHISGDHIVAVVEVVSPGNKASRHAFQALINKACELIENKIHLVILDLFPPTKRDPQGIHAALWEEIADGIFTLPSDKPLVMASYESALTVRAFVEIVAVGDELPDMPLFLEPGAHILVPLETTYSTAFEAVPRRWRAVLDDKHRPS
jgi:hypothetical protein